MNIAEFLRSVNTFDLLIVLVLFAMFILGFIQGSIRRLLGIASVLFSFLLAANLREPLGNYLTANWSQFPGPYATMIGFGTVFVAAVLAFSLVIQTFYKKVSLFSRFAVIDEVLGGLLGIVQGALILGALIVILDSYFQLPATAAREGELPLLREMFVAYDRSGTGVLFRDTLVPGFLAVTGPLVPAAIKNFFPGKTA
ncbi:MAG TPA: CvpA family protein [Candidatus Limnocylindrales bacterium]|nr:CvpA family protein [Candidatus Limnocylindrales bacterium]